MPIANIDLSEHPLTEAELERLEAFLKSRQVTDPDAMGLEMLDGFFAALICSPEIVLPSEYLPEVLGHEMEFGTEKDASEILGLMMRHWNIIADTLEKDEIYLPLCTEWDGEIPRGNDWAKGFMRGLDMRHEAWSDLLQDDERSGCVLPMMILNYEHDPDPEMRPKPITPEARKEIVAFMAAGLLRAYQHFKSERAEATASLRDDFDDSEDESVIRVVRDQAKVGRNDPCPCGSGKKYKRCHGAAKVQ